MLLTTLIDCSFQSESVLCQAPECTDTLETLFLMVKPKLTLCTKAQPGVPCLPCGCQVLQQFSLCGCLACIGLATGANLIGGKDIMWICGPLNLRLLWSVFCSCPALPVGNSALLIQDYFKGSTSQNGLSLAEVVGGTWRECESGRKQRGKGWRRQKNQEPDFFSSVSQGKKMILFDHY